MNFFLLAAIEAFQPRSREEFANDWQNFKLELGGMVIWVVLD